MVDKEYEQLENQVREFLKRCWEIKERLREKEDRKT